MTGFLVLLNVKRIFHVLSCSDSKLVVPFVKSSLIDHGSLWPNGRKKIHNHFLINKANPCFGCDAFILTNGYGPIMLRQWDSPTSYSVKSCREAWMLKILSNWSSLSHDLAPVYLHDWLRVIISVPDFSHICAGKHGYIRTRAPTPSFMLPGSQFGILNVFTDYFFSCYNWLMTVETFLIELRFL